MLIGAHIEREEGDVRLCLELKMAVRELTGGEEGGRKGGGGRGGCGWKGGK
jgi:hypothetical protein